MTQRKVTDEEFVERVKNIDWSSSKLKALEPDKIDLVLERLDKIIELLTPASVTSSNEIFQDLRREVVQRDTKGKRLRDGLLNDDGSVEWVREYS